MRVREIILAPEVLWLLKGGGRLLISENLMRAPGNLARHPIKDEFMEGPHGSPVQQTKQAMRIEIRAGGQQGLSIFLGCGQEFQPGLPGEFHFGTQTH